MSAFLLDHGVAYFSVPKCACTSIKTMLFEVENGFEWRDLRANGKGIYVHFLYQSRPFKAHKHRARPGDWKFAVVRDPLSRLASCYRNRFISGAARREIEVKKAELEERGLEEWPDFDGFVAELEAYKELSEDVRHHAAPLTHYLGDEPGFYDRIYDIDEVGTMHSDLAARIPGLPAMPHLQTRGSSVWVGEPKNETVAKIREVYARDYEIYGASFKVRDAA